MKPPPLRPGSLLDGRYEIGEKLASGSMGTVYRARQVQLDRQVAIKVLDVDTRLVREDASDDHAARFLRESSILSRLTHPNTVRVFDYGLVDGQPYLVMEFIAGSTLRDVLLREPMPPLRAVRIARQVCESLSEAHGQGLIHRDLKPANILVTQKGDGSDHVKVVDFGLVKEMNDAVTMTGDGVLLGTPMYMAPEQIRGRALDQRCDIYAIGILLYQCIAGRPPFNGQQTAATLMAHLTEEVPPFSLTAPGLELPENLEWTVKRCLEKKPQDRFATTEELTRALKICEASLLNPEVTQSMSLQLVGGQTVVQQVSPRSAWLRGGTPAVIAFAALFALVFGYVLTQGMAAFRAAEVVAALEPSDPAAAAPLGVRPPSAVVVEPAAIVGREEGGSDAGSAEVEPPPPPPRAATEEPAERPEPREATPRARPAAQPARPVPPPPAPVAPAPVAPAPAEPAPAPGLDVRRDDLKNPFQ